MNVFYKFLFYIKAKNLITDVLMYLLPATDNNIIEMNSLSSKLEKIHFYYKKVQWKEEPCLQKTLLLIYEAKKNYLNQNYKESKKLAFEIKKIIISSNGTFTDIGKNILLFSAELIEIKSLSDEWAMNVNESFNIFYKDFFLVTEEILKNRQIIIGKEINTDKDNLLLSSKYLTDLILLTKMTEQKSNGEIVSDEKKEEGRIILNKIIYFENKLKNFKNETFTFTYNLLLEKIKIGFYLHENLENNFKLMSEFCYLCINNNIEDPVYSALESFRINKNKNNSFKDYLYGFKLEIFKSEDKKILLKLQKIENYIAKEEERIIVRKVKNIEELNAKI